VEDGRFFLQTRRARWDLITSEPSPPKIPGIVNLFTREYFGLLRARLRPGGIVSYRLPVHDLLPREVLSVTRAFCDVFRDCTLWSGAGLDWMLVGTRDATWRTTPARLRRQWERPEVAAELRALGFEVPEQLLATFLAGTRRLDALTAGVPPLVDDFPHRLSNDPVVPERVARSPLVRGLLDPASQGRELRASAFVERHVPDALRDAALPWLRWQHVIDLRLVPGWGDRLSERDLHRVLVETPLRTLPLWLLGSSAAEQRIVASRTDLATRQPGWWLARGVGAMAARDYAKAADAFGRASAALPRASRPRALELLALCMAGEGDGELAASRARALVEVSPRAARHDAWWQWLGETFGLPDPRGRRPSAGRSSPPGAG
jgi:hypothetical protein